MKPFLKWVGGKTKLCSKLLFLAPKLGPSAAYFEPFLGGGAFFLALSEAGFKGGARLSDANTSLIDCYRAVQGAPDILAHRLSNLALTYLYQGEDARRATYLTMRAAFNAARRVPTTPFNDDPGSYTFIEKAALFIALNKTCFNGLWRVNRKGDFNVPHGQMGDPTILDRENLFAVSSALAGALLGKASFENAIATARAGDLVYFDPPYEPLTETANFTSYTATKFGPEDQDHLRDTALELISRGTFVMLSNSDTPRNRARYAHPAFRIHEVSVPRAINCDGSKRGAVGELIITGGYK